MAFFAHSLIEFLFARIALAMKRLASLRVRKVEATGFYSASRNVHELRFGFLR